MEPLQPQLGWEQADQTGPSFPVVQNPDLSFCWSLELNHLCSSPDGDMILWSPDKWGSETSLQEISETTSETGYSEELDHFMTINNIYSY